MQVLILGAGAIGGYYGARLVQAGHRVQFLVRRGRAAQLAADGLRIHGGDWSFAAAVETVAVAPDSPCDLVVLSCKAWDLDSAIEAVAPAVGAQTRVLPLLNGLRQLDALDSAFGAPRVLGGVCHISVTLEADGSIRQFGTLDRLTFGSRHLAHPVPVEIATSLRAMQDGVIESDAILFAMWEKFCMIAALAGITCLMRAAVGEIVATSEGADLARRLYAECGEVARCSGYPVSAAAAAEAQRMLTQQGSPLKASMLRDLERGARTEAEHILGDLQARARSYSLDTPLLDAALTHLRVHEAQRLSGSKAG